MMVSDGVDDRAEAAGRADVDVRDVANLLLESIDRSAVTLPAKGTAAKQAAQAAPKARPHRPHRPHRPRRPPSQRLRLPRPHSKSPPKPSPAWASPGRQAAGSQKGSCPNTTAAARSRMPKPKQHKLSQHQRRPRPGNRCRRQAAWREKGPAQGTPPEQKPESESAASDKDGDRESQTPPVKGLGIARGARPPGKR
ncbi:hypothetical protein I552_0151 [Mycobacterium xenopi 3993]|nr:hypothetical protein I552_0151 [Mycobacterium xenopi 3993]